MYLVIVRQCKNNMLRTTSARQSRPDTLAIMAIWSHSAGEWHPVFCFRQERKYSSDVAKIYSVHITNVIRGVASQCRRCALSSAEASSACVPCPPGHYMVNGTGVCKSCPPNTFIRADQPVGEAACVPCGPNTERNEVMGTNPFHWKSANTGPWLNASAWMYVGLLRTEVFSSGFSLEIWALSLSIQTLTNYTLWDC